MKLTDRKIKALEAKAVQYEEVDGHGLRLRVTPSGSKLWHYRYRFGGKEKLLSLGSYPLVSLADARVRRDRARLALLDGVDPAAEKRQAKMAAKLNSGNTFEVLANEFIEEVLVKKSRDKTTITKQRWLLKQLAFVARRPISEIEPPELLAILRKLQGQRKHETAKRCRSFASRVFSYAIATGRATNDPAAKLDVVLTSPKVRHHAAIVDPKAVGTLLRCIDEYDGAPITRLALQILPHVMARPGELRNATWDEFDFKEKIWRIAPERMKMKRPHAVPLSKQVIAYLNELKLYSDPTGYLFPGFASPRRPMSENTLNVALRRMGYTKDEMTAHGFRSTASTLLNESGLWSADGIEKALAHGGNDAIRAIYNRGSYQAERVRMMAWWSDYLDRLREGGEVIPFQSAGAQ